MSSAQTCSSKVLRGKLELILDEYNERMKKLAAITMQDPPTNITTEHHIQVPINTNE